MEDEKRKRALRYLNITGTVQCVLGLLLLILGLVAKSNHGPYAESIPPYFIGAFIGITVVLLQACVGFIVYFRGKDCINKLEAAEKIGCIMQTYCVVAIVSGMGYVVAMLLVGFTGICDTGGCSYTEAGVNRGLAITILVFICLGVTTSAIGLAIVCKYSSSFGLKILSRGQFQISNLVDNTDAVIERIAAEQTQIETRIAANQNETMGPEQTPVTYITANQHETMDPEQTPVTYITANQHETMGPEQTPVTYIAANQHETMGPEQTPVTYITANEQQLIGAEQTHVTNILANQNQANRYHHPPLPSPRLAFPDFTSPHLQDVITQQYKDQIRKRRKKHRKRNKENEPSNDATRRRREREAPYILPPVAEPSGSYSPPQESLIRTRIPPLRPSSPPHLPVLFPPPSPSPPSDPTPPEWTVMPSSPPRIHTPRESTDTSSSPSSPLPLPRPPTPPRSRKKTPVPRPPTPPRSRKQTRVPRPPTPPRSRKQTRAPRPPTPPRSSKKTRAPRPPTPPQQTRSPSPPRTPTPPQWATRSHLPSQQWAVKSWSQSPFSLAMSSDSPPMQYLDSPSPPSTPPQNYPGVIHVIPCGEFVDEDFLHLHNIH